MTLNLTLINHRHCIIATDRRITSSENPIDDEHDKSCVLFTDDARIGLTFSGLAKVGSFSTHSWLLKKLLELAPPDYTAGGIIDRLRQALDEEFQSNHKIRRLRKTDQRLSIMMAGFVYGGSLAAPFVCILSNWEHIDGQQKLDAAADKFSLSFLRAPIVGQTWAYPLGLADPVDQKSIQKLVDAAYRLPINAVAQWLAQILRDSAQSPKAKGLIGKQIVTLHLPIEPSEDVTSNYFTAQAKQHTLMTASVWAQSSGTLSILSVEIGPASPEDPPMAVPRVHKNAPCPCGSGKRYKHCHRKNNR